ncbi:MAG: heme exporter protein CcmD [Pseudomonadota bacterium]
MIPVFDHTGPFIWAAYAFSGLVLGGLIAVTFARAARAKAKLAALEAEPDA